MPANHCTPHTEEAKVKMRLARTGIPAPWKHRESRVVGGIQQWKCGRCLSFFPREGFYKDSRTLLGIKSECRKCHGVTSMKSRDPELTRVNRREFARRDREANPDKYREREKVASHKRIKDGKYKARVLLNGAVRTGKVLKPGGCSHCGKQVKLTAHHHDYSLPLDVIWLCYQCHADLERGVWVISFKRLEPALAESEGV